MSELISVTRCSLDELEEVTTLFELYRSFYEQSSDRDACRRFLQHRLAQQESVIFLARLNTRAVGFVQLYPSFSSIAMNRIWILNDLFVLESARKQGVASALMHTAEEFANESKAVRLTLATGVNNLTAQSLYESLGWQKDDAYYHYLKPIEQPAQENPDDV